MKNLLVRCLFCIVPAIILGTIPTVFGVWQVGLIVFISVFIFGWRVTNEPTRTE